MRGMSKPLVVETIFNAANALGLVGTNANARLAHGAP
jgi:hypothetical protein